VVVNSMTLINIIKERIGWKRAIPSILLVSNTFVWYIVIYLIFSNIVNELELFEAEKMILFTLYFIGIAVSAILGSQFFQKARVKLLYVWLLMDTAVTPLLVTVPGNGLSTNVFALLLGFSIGIGLPSCLSYFADSTKIENRGLVGGITWSITGFMVLLFIIIANIIKIWEIVTALTVWRVFGGICFAFLSRQHKESGDQKPQSYLELIHKRDVWLYLFPWIMFSLINFAELPILERVFGTEVFVFVTFTEYVFAGIFAFVGGISADLAGRKRIAIIGFIMLGIEYAALSIFYDSPVVSYLFMVLDGITWGLFFSVFFMTVWGDLGEGYEKEKYYALGGLPFLLSNYISILVNPYVSVISPTAAFSFASFFLFLAVIPLMYAPETLPEKHVRERELREYIEKAKKIKEKYG